MGMVQVLRTERPEQDLNVEAPRHPLHGARDVGAARPAHRRDALDPDREHALRQHNELYTVRVRQEAVGRQTVEGRHAGIRGGVGLHLHVLRHVGLDDPDPRGRPQVERRPADEGVADRQRHRHHETEDRPAQPPARARHRALAPRSRPAAPGGRSASSRPRPGGPPRQPHLGPQPADEGEPEGHAEGAHQVGRADEAGRGSQRVPQLHPGEGYGSQMTAQPLECRPEHGQGHPQRPAQAAAHQAHRLAPRRQEARQDQHRQHECEDGEGRVVDQRGEQPVEHERIVDQTQEEAPPQRLAPALRVVRWQPLDPHGVGNQRHKRGEH